MTILLRCEDEEMTMVFVEEFIFLDWDVSLNWVFSCLLERFVGAVIFAELY